MLYPAIDQVTKLLNDYDLVPVFYEILSDTCTPIQIFNTFKEVSDTCFILESVENVRQWGRYSFIGINPCAELKIAHGKACYKENGIEEITGLTDIGAYLNQLMSRYSSPVFSDMPKLTGGFIGYLGYDIVRYLEPRLANIPPDDLDLPDCHLFLYDQIIAYDHLKNKVVIIQNISRNSSADVQYALCEQRARDLCQTINNVHPIGSPLAAAGEMAVRSNFTKNNYIQTVEKAKEHIVAGDIFQIVPSQRFEIENPPDSFAVYRNLRASNPSPYLYYFKYPDYQIAGASPEMLINVNRGIVTSKPIAGTAPRGIDDAQDDHLRKSLLNDPKERAEHTMLVDLGRNDIGKVSEFGTVDIIDFMRVEQYSRVMHLVSTVRGTLKADKTAVDALLAAIPAGTLSGAPKIRAMELIDELEPCKRGLYGGTIGYLGFNGNVDTCIAIRTVLYKNGRAYVQAGGGVVADSIPEKEYEETRNKAQAVIDALYETKNNGF